MWCRDAFLIKFNMTYTNRWLWASASLTFSFVRRYVDFHAYDKHLLHHNNRFALCCGHCYTPLSAEAQRWAHLTFSDAEADKRSALLYKIPPLWPQALDSPHSRLNIQHIRRQSEASPQGKGGTHGTGICTDTGRGRATLLKRKVNSK